MQSIFVPGGTTLFHVAAAYLGDATQWSRIALVNNLSDPFAFGAPVTLTLPAAASSRVPAHA